MRGPDYANVILDTHPYQCFTDDDRKRNLHQQVEFALLERKTQLAAMQKQLPCIVGEWSCALPRNHWGAEPASRSTPPCGPMAMLS